MPADSKLQRLFVNTNWANLIQPSIYNSSSSRISNNLPALQFLDGDAQFNVVNKAIDILMETITVPDRKQLKALEWSLNEVTDNVLNHAESQIGGILQIQCFPNRNEVSFYVVDAGLGVPATLRKSLPQLTSDSEALDRAIREGVTRNSSTNQGNGLFGAFKCCEVSNGVFNVRSNHASLNYKRGEFAVSRENVPFRGSFISGTINYSTSELLEKALVFKGKIHEPSYDYIDIHYTHIGEKTIFRFCDEVEGFGSREYGRRAKLRIDNILVDKKNSIILDFSGAPIVSSNFADEVLGKLFVGMGPMEFVRRCEFRNVDPTVRRLIDRAIAQRMKTG